MADEPASGEAPDLDDLLVRLRERVQHRRDAGAYPPGLEDTLDEHFRHLTGERPPSLSFVLDELDVAMDDLRQFSFGRERIPLESQLPGGVSMHRAVAKVVARQVQGVLEQAQDQSHRVARTLGLMAEATEQLAEAFDTRVLQQLDDLQTRVSEDRRELASLIARLDDMTSRVLGAGIEPFYTADAFTAHFRGDVDDLRDRYRELALEFAGCSPVLDIGFGRGEFLELLRDEGVDAFGIEVDPRLVEWARSRGLRADTGGAIEYLRDLDDASLGGIVMIQVIEHLSPQHVIDVVKLAAEKVRPGGRVVMETINPTSLFTYAHAFWVDPDHVRPVHPTYLGFLFAEAGFATVRRLDRSPVASDESLELIPGDDELAKRLNANFERLNALVFGPQDYAIVATR